MRWVNTVQDKRQILGDDIVDTACETIQELTGSIDEALDHAYMAGILASDQSTNAGEPLFKRKPVPIPESADFHQNQLSASQKPKIIRRALHLITKALLVYEKVDKIKYPGKYDPDIEYEAFEYWLEDDNDAYEIIETYRERLQRSYQLGKEKLQIGKRLGAIPKSSNLTAKSTAADKGQPSRKTDVTTSSQGKPQSINFPATTHRNT